MPHAKMLNRAYWLKHFSFIAVVLLATLVALGYWRTEDLYGRFVSACEKDGGVPHVEDKAWVCSFNGIGVPNGKQ